jgi:hypothetical protein
VYSNEQAVYRLLIVVLKPVTKSGMQRQKEKTILTYVSENSKQFARLLRNIPKRSARCACDDAILRDDHLDAVLFPALDFTFRANGRPTAGAENTGQHCPVAGKTADDELQAPRTICTREGTGCIKTRANKARWLRPQYCL